MPRGRTIDRLKRLDWITCMLQDGEKINATVVKERFGVSRRTFLYDIEILRAAYPAMKITWNPRERTFFIDE